MYVESGANANKFYRAELHDDGTVVKNWGRVGAAGQTKVEAGGKDAYEAVIRQKLGRGYTKVDIVTSTAGATALTRGVLKHAASASLTGGSTDPVLADLIDRLVAENKHQLMAASGGLITVDLAGQVTTPLGVVSAASLRDARQLLEEMNTVSESGRGQLTERYLRLVPQKIPISAGRGWADGWLTTMTTPGKQEALLDALEASVRYAEAAADAVNTSADHDHAGLFRYRVRALRPSSREFKAVVARFEETKQTVHTSVRLQPVRVFALDDARHGAQVQETAQRVRNVHRYWHGTGAANVLSILSTGLFVPPARGSGIHIAGRMFGDGVYLSRSATKSLNYSVGLWGGGAASSTFMFLTETAMGNEYRPGTGYDPQIAYKARTQKNARGVPYNSINVRPGKGGVRNHEAIVWDPMQVNLRWLVEFSASPEAK